MSNIINFPDSNEGQTKWTWIVPSISNDYPFQCLQQFTYVSGVQVFKKMKNKNAPLIGLPNFLLTGLVFTYQLAKVYDPIHINEPPVVITLYVYFDCRSAQIKCVAVSTKATNKVDFYSFLDNLYNQRLIKTPPGYHLPNVPKNKPILLVPKEYAKNIVIDNLTMTKHIPIVINPFFWKDRRTPQAIKQLLLFLTNQKEDELLKEGLNKIPTKIMGLVNMYNNAIHKKLGKLNERDNRNFTPEDVQKLQENVDWNSTKSIIIKS
jgi:hypothetical protein